MNHEEFAKQLANQQSQINEKTIGLFSLVISEEDDGHGVGAVIHGDSFDLLTVLDHVIRINFPENQRKALAISLLDGDKQAARLV